MENMLEKVRTELVTRKGDLMKIARETKVSYDTILRIRDNECDPGYSKVETLYQHLFAAGRPVSSAASSDSP